MMASKNVVLLCLAIPLIFTFLFVDGIEAKSKKCGKKHSGKVKSESSLVEPAPSAGISLTDHSNEHPKTPATDDVKKGDKEQPHAGKPPNPVDEAASLADIDLIDQDNDYLLNPSTDNVNQEPMDFSMLLPIDEEAPPSQSDTPTNASTFEVPSWMIPSESLFGTLAPMQEKGGEAYDFVEPPHKEAEEFCIGKKNGMYPDEQNYCSYYYYCYPSPDNNPENNIYVHTGCPVDQIFDKNVDDCVEHNERNQGKCPV